MRKHREKERVREKPCKGVMDPIFVSKRWLWMLHKEWIGGESVDTNGWPNCPGERWGSWSWEEGGQNPGELRRLNRQDCGGRGHGEEERSWGQKWLQGFWWNRWAGGTLGRCRLRRRRNIKSSVLFQCVLMAKPKAGSQKSCCILFLVLPLISLKPEISKEPWCPHADEVNTYINTTAP